MAFKFVDGNSFKQRWKSAKASALKIGYRNFNAKFIKNPADINRFFDGCLVDITPADNPKGKTKLGTVYILPDGQTHVVKFSLDRSRMKIYVGTDNYNKQYAEWAAQHFAFLLTVE